MATADIPPALANQNIQLLSEEDERATLERLILLRDSVRAGQHPKFGKPSTNGNAASTKDKPNTNGHLPAGPGDNLNGNANRTADAARPIPVFPPVLSTPTGERAVVTLNGKDSPKQYANSNNNNNNNNINRAAGKEQRDDKRLQQASQNLQQWDPNQRWMMPQVGQNMAPGTQGDIKNFGHLPMLPVPPPGFDIPPGFQFPPLPLPGQPIPPPNLLHLANQKLPHSDPMVVEKPVENIYSDRNGRDPAINLSRKNDNSQVSIPPSANDYQATLKKAQDYAASLPSKLVGDQKQNAASRGDLAKQLPADKNRNNQTDTSPITPSFDKREEERQAYQRQPPRDHRQYNDKRGAEPLRKTAMNNNHNIKDDRRERDREQFTRERERFQERDRRQPGDNRNFKVSPILSRPGSPLQYGNDDTKEGVYMQKRKSISPEYDAPPKHLAPGYQPPPPGRQAADNMALTRSLENHKVLGVDDVDDNLAEQKRRANNPKDVIKNQDKKPSPQAPIKREPQPPSPVVTIPRGSPGLEDVSPGRAQAYGLPPARDRYGPPPAVKHPPYPRYREPYPMVGYARGPYDLYDPYDPYDPYAPPPSHPGGPHARDSRALSPRRVYLDQEGRGYTREYVYPDPYHDPYYGYRSRRPASPYSRGPATRYGRYEDDEPSRPPVRGRSPSPRGAPGRVPMPAPRPRRSSRSVSPPRERPPPPPRAVGEPGEELRQERSLIRAVDAPQYADYPPPHHRSMVPYDPYARPMIIRERVPVYVPHYVYVDPNDPDGRPLRPRSPGYASQPPPPLPPPASSSAAPPSQAHAGHPTPPPARRYADEDMMLNERYYRERDYDYGPYERGGYMREYGREYSYPPPPPPHSHPSHPPPMHAREGYPREYAMPPASREEDRVGGGFRDSREYGAHPHPPHPGHQGHPPPPPTPRDVEDSRMPYARETRGGPPPPVPGGRYP